MDAIRTMAQAIWRKQHLSVYALAAEARALYGHLFRFPNDLEGFRKYYALRLNHLMTTMQAMYEKHRKYLEVQESTQSDEAEQNEDQTYQHEKKRDLGSLATKEDSLFAAGALMQTATKQMLEGCPNEQY